MGFLLKATFVTKEFILRISYCNICYCYIIEILFSLHPKNIINGLDFRTLALVYWRAAYSSNYVLTLIRR